MSLTVTESGGGTPVPILPEGTYVATCYMLVDLGLQHNATYNNDAKKVLMGWEIADEFVTVDGEKKPRVFSTRYTASLNEKSVLRRDLIAWRGRDFTPAELEEFNLRNVVGKSCLLSIVHKDASNGKTYANLAAIIGLPKGTPKPQCSLEPVIYDIEEDEPDKINELPEWIANMIKSSPTYQERIAVKPNTIDKDFYEDDEEGLPF